MSSMRSASSRTRTCSAWKVIRRRSQEIFQTAWGGDHQASAAAQRGQLVSFRQATYDQGCGRQFCAAQGVVLVNHLHGKFARRDETRAVPEYLAEAGAR